MVRTAGLAGAAVRAVMVVSVAGALLAGCGPAPSPSGSAATVQPSASAGASPSSLPASPSAGPSPSADAAPSAAAACPGAGPFVLPSHRFVELRVGSVGAADRVEFVFGAPGPSPAFPGQAVVASAEPPFTMAASGLPFELEGRRFTEVVMTAMLLFDDTGTATYAGPAVIRPRLPAIRELRLFDASEGHVGWLIGHDGPGCLALAAPGDGSVVALEIEHPPS
jgi:hypothetical protein